MTSLNYRDIVLLNRLVAKARKDNSQDIGINKEAIEKHNIKAGGIEDNADLRFHNEKQEYLFEQQTALYDNHEALIALSCKLSELL